MIERGNMTELEKQRLQDFRMVLRYHLCSKIKHFRCTPKEFYAACKLYDEFKKTHAYNKRIFELLAYVNDSGLNRAQLRGIFGYAPGRKWIAYKQLIDESEITVRNHGTQYCKKSKFRRHFNNCYFLPYDEIAKVFADKELLDKVLDATSEIYTPRQRCLIFNQIIGENTKNKNSRYKTNKEIIQEKAENLSEKEIDDLISDLAL